MSDLRTSVIEALECTRKMYHRYVEDCEKFSVRLEKFMIDIEINMDKSTIVTNPWGGITIMCGEPGDAQRIAGEFSTQMDVKVNKKLQDDGRFSFYVYLNQFDASIWIVGMPDDRCEITWTEEVVTQVVRKAKVKCSDD